MNSKTDELPFDKDFDLNGDFEEQLEEPKEAKEPQAYPLRVNITESKFSIFDINEQLKDELINLAPDYQRCSRWNPTQQSELVESILMGLPIPPIYTSQSKTGVLEIVDGKQRIKAVTDFLDGKFKLQKLKNLWQLNGKKFEELEPHKRAQFKRWQLSFYIFLPDTDERIKFDIFDRVNRGGTKINNQEMRNALYQGEATAQIDKFAANENFVKAAGISPDMKKAMKDRYVVTRWLCFYLYLECERIKAKVTNGIDEFLKSVLSEINEKDFKFDFDGLYAKFDKAMEFANLNYADNLFRFETKESGKNRRKLNLPLFESLTYALVLKNGEFFSQDEISKFKEELDKPERITFGIDSANNINFRFNLAKDLANGKQLSD